jgi:scyllo-inositol 2-dehydrogenase (NADP+)
VDQVLQLFGPAAEVYAEMERRHPDVVVEDEAFLSIRHVQGVRSHLYMSTAAAQPAARMSAWGSRAAYVKHGLDVQEAALRAGTIPGSAGWGVEPQERWGWIGTLEERRHHPTEAGAYPAFYAAVERAVRGGSAPPVQVADAAAGLEVIEAAHRSAVERRVVTVAG